MHSNEKINKILFSWYEWMPHLICHGDEYREQKEKIYSKAIVSDLKIQILIEESSASREKWER
jgi:hypothetical protein